MNDILMQTTVKRYVCSKCWGHLVAYADDETRWKVECPRCGPGQGFVTKYYADQRRENSMGELRDICGLLQEMGVVENPQKDKSADQLLEELGF